MPPATNPAASTCGKFRPSVGFKMSDTNMLVGQTAIQLSNAIFQRGGTLFLFGKEPTPFIPSPFLILSQTMPLSSFTPPDFLPAAESIPPPPCLQLNGQILSGRRIKAGKYHNGLVRRSSGAGTPQPWPRLLAPLRNARRSAR